MANITPEFNLAVNKLAKEYAEFVECCVVRGLISKESLESGLRKRVKKELFPLFRDMFGRGYDKGRRLYAEKGE